MAKKNKKEDFDNMLMNHKDLFVRIKGIKLKVREGVFSPDPAITNSTSLLVNSIKNVKDKDVLDLACGSGIISIYCAKNGAKRVVASDVDVKAIRNTKENLGSLGLSGKVEVVKSSLFENIDGKFDFIFGNLPINENLWDIEPKKLIRKFIKEAKNYLKKDGKIYFIWFSISEVSPIREYCLKNGYVVNEKTEEKYGFTWHLFELSLRD